MGQKVALLQGMGGVRNSSSWKVLGTRSQCIMFCAPIIWGQIYFQTCLIALWLELMLGCLAALTYITGCPLGPSPTSDVISVTEYIAGPAFVGSWALISIPCPERSDFWRCSPQQLVAGLALITLFSIHANSYLASAHWAIFESGKISY